MAVALPTETIEGATPALPAVAAEPARGGDDWGGGRWLVGGEGAG